MPSRRRTVALVVAVAGLVLAVLAWRGGSAVAAWLLMVGLGAVSAVLWWIDHPDDRIVRRRRRRVGMILLGGLGLLLLLAAAVTSGAERGDVAVLALAGLGCLAGVVVWWVVSRDSRVADRIDGSLPLGDGATVSGTRIPMPRSKRLALTVGTLLMAATGVGIGVVMRADGDGLAWMMFLVGAFFAAIGMHGIANVRTPAWLGFSHDGLTVHGWRQHVTLPWGAVGAVEAYDHEVRTRYATTRMRMLGIQANLDAAHGSLGPWVRRMAALNERSGWTLSFPQTLFDLPVEEIATIAAEYRPDPPDGTDPGR